VENNVWDDYWENCDTDCITVPTDILRHLACFPKDALILEAGCGTGNVVIPIVAAGYRNIIGLDFSESAINKARIKFPEGKFIVGDIKSLPFEDDKFDFICSLGVIEHFNDPMPLLAEMKRVLKKNGVLYLTTPNKYNFLHTFLRTVLNLAGKWKIGYEKSYSLFELSSLLKTAGFFVIEKYNYSFWYFDFLLKNKISQLVFGKKVQRVSTDGFRKFCEKTYLNNMSFVSCIISRKH